MITKYTDKFRAILKDLWISRAATPHPLRGGVPALGPLGTLAIARRAGRGMYHLDSEEVTDHTPNPSPTWEGNV